MLAPSSPIPSNVQSVRDTVPLQPPKWVASAVADMSRRVPGRIRTLNRVSEMFSDTRPMSPMPGVV